MRLGAVRWFWLSLALNDYAPLPGNVQEVKKEAGRPLSFSAFTFGFLTAAAMTLCLVVNQSRRTGF